MKRNLLEASRLDTKNLFAETSDKNLKVGKTDRGKF